MDPATTSAIVALLLGVAGGIVGWRKVGPEAESVATRTTLEIIEALRVELGRSQEEAHRLHRRLQKRDEEIEHLSRRVRALRSEVDVLDAEVNALRATTGTA